MKGKNSAFCNKLCCFFGKEYSSAREYVVIYFLSLIIELWNRIFFLELWNRILSLSSLDSKEYNIFSLELWNKIFFFQSLGSNGEWTGWQDTPLFLSVCVLASYCSVCLDLVSSYVDTLHHIVAFVGKKYSEIERNKPATG
ncbi:hypothetical protein [Bartonella sp. MR30HLJHH]|uniref:hypothetical protein n=1 Tax=Bartonella sp. MR30HLJHH TaxID=3243557 RepID=UPI0035D06672